MFGFVFLPTVYHDQPLRRPRNDRTKTVTLVAYSPSVNLLLYICSILFTVPIAKLVGLMSAR